MWSSFFFGFFALTVLLFVPGFLLSKICMKSYVLSFCFAPAVSMACYELLSIIFGEMGIFANWFSCSIVVVSVSAIACFIVFKLRPCRFTLSTEEKRGELSDLRIAILYVICGIALVGIVMVKGFDGAASYGQSYDNYFHLTVPQVYLETGNWSTFHPSLFVPQAGTSDVATIGYYPAEWHMLVALTASTISAPIAVSVNIVNSFFSSVGFACGMFVLLRQIFVKDRLGLAFGSIATFGFAAFPYMALTSGLMPNFTSVCLVPYPLAAFLMVLDVFSKDKKPDFGLSVIFLLTILAVGFCHPSSFFTVLITMVIILSSFVIRRNSMLIAKRIALVVGLVVCLVLFLLLMFNSSLVQIMATYPTDPSDTPQQAIVDILSYSFLQGTAQIIVGCCVIVGMMTVLIKKRNGWVLVAFVVFSAFFFLTAAISEESLIRSFFTAYWYSNSWRTSWNVVLFAIPLLALGMAGICRVAIRLLSKSQSLEIKRCQVYIGSLLFLTLALAPVIPVFQLRGFAEFKNAFDRVEQAISDSYNMKSNERVYTSRESKFVDEAANLIGSNAVVMNIPHDGSFLAFPANGLNTFSRTFAAPPGDARLLGLKLNEYATNDEVRTAVERAGIEYVLLLDEGDYDKKEGLSFFYQPDLWCGVYSIDENTEGFDLVLEEEDMKLYRLTL